MCLLLVYVTQDGRTLVQQEVVVAQPEIEELSRVSITGVKLSYRLERDRWNRTDSWTNTRSRPVIWGRADLITVEKQYVDSQLASLQFITLYSLLKVGYNMTCAAIYRSMRTS